MDKKRVVITGIGLITPGGETVDEFWDNIINGRSFINKLTNFDTSKYRVKIGGECKDFNPSAYIPRKAIIRTDRFMHLGIAATIKLTQDVGHDMEHFNSERFGITVSAGLGGAEAGRKTITKLVEKGPRSAWQSYTIPSMLINLLAGHITQIVGAKGLVISPVSACATGSHSIGLAFDFIRQGRLDYAIAGAADNGTCESGIGGFAAMGALSKNNKNPKKASRPFDKDRDGFVISEGGCVLLLEEYEHAKKRNAKIYAEIVGFGMSSETYSSVLADPDGDGAKRCMLNAIEDAGITPDDIDYINCHATATPDGDISEGRAIKDIFPEYPPAISSTKSITGHFLGTAGAIESTICCLALKNEFIPPNINLDNLDPEFEGLNVVNIGFECGMNYVMNNSFGFGGTNCTLIFKYCT